MRNFEIAALASGSKGNAVLVHAEKKYILIDMGISCRELTKKLDSLGLTPDKLDAVLITHEHIDHIKGLQTFMKKYTVPVYTSFHTWQGIYRQLPKLERSASLEMPSELLVGNLSVKAFAIPHDANDPHGYIIESEKAKFAYVTDTGFVTDSVREAAEGCETLVLEANHDIEMLKQGPYPYHLKQRILSTLGHLANATTAELLTELELPPERVILAHLSEQNNTPSKAYNTVCRQLEKYEKTRNIKIYIASQKNIVKDYEHYEEQKF